MAQADPRASVARSASRLRKLCTGKTSGVIPRVRLAIAAGERCAGADDAAALRLAGRRFGRTFDRCRLLAGDVEVPYRRVRRKEDLALAGARFRAEHRESIVAIPGRRSGDVVHRDGRCWVRTMAARNAATG